MAYSAIVWYIMILKYNINMTAVLGFLVLLFIIVMNFIMDNYKFIKKKK